MNFYESIFVCSPLLSEEDIDALIEKVKGLISKGGGEIKNVNKWGKKKLAYPIKRHREGYYVILEFYSPADKLRELENLYRVTDKIIRYLTVKKEERVPVLPRSKPITAETKTQIATN